jgi:hypothetical protein
MSWIVETGAIVSGANTYISTAGAIAYALARGYVIDPTKIDVYMQQAMDMFETLNFVGCRVSDSQSLQFPRDNVYIFHILQLDNTIPLCVKNALCEIVIQLSLGNDPLANTQKAIKSERMDVFDVTYMDGYSEDPIYRRINMWLKYIVCGSLTGLNFKTERSYG